jgi:hypothetical protein
MTWKIVNLKLNVTKSMTKPALNDVCSGGILLNLDHG